MCIILCSFFLKMEISSETVIKDVKDAKNDAKLKVISSLNRRCWIGIRISQFSGVKW